MNQELHVHTRSSNVRSWVTDKAPRRCDLADEISSPCPLRALLHENGVLHGGAFDTWRVPPHIFSSFISTCCGLRPVGSQSPILQALREALTSPRIASLIYDSKYATGGPVRPFRHVRHGCAQAAGLGRNRGF